MKGAVADLLAEDAEFPGIMEIEFFQVPHIRIDKTIEYPLAAGHDLIIPDRLGIFCINDSDLGQVIMFIRQFIRIVQKEKLYGGEHEKTYNGNDLMCSSGILHYG